MIFSTFLIFRAPRPLFGSSDREKGGKYAGIDPMFQHFSTAIFRRLHASDPVIPRVKRIFTPFQQFQQPYI